VMASVLSAKEVIKTEATSFTIVVALHRVAF